MTKERLIDMNITSPIARPIGAVMSKLLALAAAACLMVLVVASTVHASSGPELEIATAAPTFAQTGRILLNAEVRNVGEAATNGEPLTMKVEVPAGFAFDIIQKGANDGGGRYPQEWVCPESSHESSVTCTYPAPLKSREETVYEDFDLVIPHGTAGTLKFRVTVSGGGAPTVTREDHTTIGAPGGFGVESFEDPITNQDGSPSTQAAAAPYAITTKIAFNTHSLLPLENYIADTVPIEDFKDVHLDLPPGFVGYPQAIPHCALLQLATQGVDQLSSCPTDSQVGIIRVRSSGTAPLWFNVPVYNMQPFPGSPVAFGFFIEGVTVLMNATLRSEDDYAVTVNVPDTTNALPLVATEVTIWGVPYDHSHDNERFCPGTENFYNFNGGPDGEPCAIPSPPVAFLRNPTSCPEGPLKVGLRVNDYPEGADTAEASYSNALPAPDQNVVAGITGCDKVPFAPSISIEPTIAQAGTPTGVDVTVTVPQTNSPYGLAEADLKKAVVTMPQGMTINPSAADGLGACSDAQLGLGSATPVSCPDDSKLGIVTLDTPLLPHPVEGGIYVRSQNSNDPASGEMFRIALELRDDAEGVDVKLPGYISVNPSTGQLTTTFDDAPQLPFSDITLHFKGGARAPLLNPPTCGPQSITAQLSSWAQPQSPVSIANIYQVSTGHGGGPCPPPVPFSPALFAGTENPVAGAFTPFTMTFTREDGQQTLGGLRLQMPPGLLGMVKNVTPCGEPQAAAGACGAQSLIGRVVVGAGAGQTPFYLEGRVYLTGAYKGEPFGLSIVVPAVAGPFNLGNVVVRGTIAVDLHSAALTITTDPLPQIVDGIPVFIRSVTATIDRQSFIFNPTSCEPMKIVAAITSGQGTIENVASNFQVGGCSSLSFHPKFAVSTSGHTSRLGGASLDAKLSYPPGAGQANIASVKVELPKQLPSRLTTLQKACPDAVFNANPAGCPAASAVGVARATTPLLAAQLSGPVYFVSHGGQAFPDLVVILQGEGVRVDLVGSTFISKAGITSSTFKIVPDVPVSSFELYLPQGPASALAANGNLCKGKKLTMPTAFVAQNGLTFTQKTPIAVTGCARIGKAKKARKARKAGAARLAHARGSHTRSRRRAGHGNRGGGK
jgi:hypothetical protein